MCLDLLGPACLCRAVHATCVLLSCLLLGLRGSLKPSMLAPVMVLFLLICLGFCACMYRRGEHNAFGSLVP